MRIYDFTVKTIDSKEISLERYKGKVLLVVNTASKCGFSPQYADLAKIYKEYNSQGLEILGFPCNQFAEQEPGDSSEIKSFCQINYDITFPLFEKIDVRGASAHPLFTYLSSACPFKGFDLTHPAGKILLAGLQEKLPHYLLGDSIKWNFTKFLINRNGQVVARFEPTTEPLDIVADIKELL